MNIADIQLLCDYNYWANRLILARAAELSEQQRLQSASFPFGNLHETLVHILDAEYVWRTICTHNRFDGRLVDKESFPTLESLTIYWQKEESDMRAFLNSLSDKDMNKVVRYQAGEVLRERVLWHCLIHVVNHGTQHRSQCAAMIKDFGKEPVTLDLTYYLNKRA